MTIGAAILLVAVGAILKWAVTAHVSGFDIQTAGTIVFVLGLVGLVLAVIYTFWPRHGPHPPYDDPARRGPPAI